MENWRIWVIAFRHLQPGARPEWPLPSHPQVCVCVRACVRARACRSCDGEGRKDKGGRSMSPSATPATPKAAASTASTETQARHQSQPNAISATPATQSEDTTPATQSEGPCRQVPLLPHKVNVGVTKCHACHAKLPRETVDKLCVWTSCAWTSCVWVSCVCVCKLCVSKLCVSKLCVCVQVVCE